MKPVTSTRMYQQLDKRYVSDLIDYLNERDPFVQNDSLFKFANGMTAQERVNVEKAREVGVKIVESMAGNQLTSSHSGKLIKQSR